MDTARRKFPRCPYIRPICVTYLSKSIIVEGEEIGEGGLSFLSESEIPIGTQVVLNFFISNGLFSCLRGSVLNQSDADHPIKKNNKEKYFRYGVNFNEVNITLKRQIRTFVARSLHTLKNQKSSAPPM